METTETLPVNEGAIAYQPTELELLNLKVAEKAGWTNIEVWQPKRNLPIKTFQGVNLAHPELGSFVPNYVEDLNAIFWVFGKLDIEFHLTNERVVTGGYFHANSLVNQDWYQDIDLNPAIALCKLLIAINPEPIKPQVKAEIMEALFG